MNWFCVVVWFRVLSNGWLSHNFHLFWIRWVLQKFCEYKETKSMFWMGVLNGVWLLNNRPPNRVLGVILSFNFQVSIYSFACTTIDIMSFNIITTIFLTFSTFNFQQFNKVNFQLLTIFPLYVVKISFAQKIVFVWQTKIMNYFRKISFQN